MWIYINNNDTSEYAINLNNVNNIQFIKNIENGELKYYLRIKSIGDDVHCFTIDESTYKYVKHMIHLNTKYQGN